MNPLTAYVLLTLVWCVFFIVRPLPVAAIGLIATLTVAVLIVVGRLERRRRG